MDKATKVLCVCQHGNVRSVGTRSRLTRRGFTNVIAIGCSNTSPETLAMLNSWADIILLAQPWMSKNFTSEKISPDFEIGEDVYGNYNNLQLKRLIDQELEDAEIIDG